MARIRATQEITTKRPELEFVCLGCKSVHRLPCWVKYNRNENFPTIRPEVSFDVGPFKPGHPLAGQIVRCHFRIDNGTIRYFHDSTHPLKGKTVGLPDFEELEAMRAAAAESRKSLEALAAPAAEHAQPAGIVD